MRIYPAIDLIDGQVVRLTKGHFDQKTIYNQDPLAVAKGFEHLGSRYLHIVDLDGAKQSAPQQTEIISKIVKETQLKVQVGGGIRKLEHVETLLGLGVDRVIIGSMAVKDRALCSQIMKKFGGERITLGLDVFLKEQGAMVATHGWQEVSEVRASELIEFYAEFGLSQVLCTDISRDGTLSSPNFELYESLSETYPDLVFLASGGVKTADQIYDLKDRGVGGAIIGKAIYEGTLDLSEVLQC